MAFLADLLVIGERNRSTATRRSRSSPSKRSRSDCGSKRRPTGVANRPAAAFQKALPANAVAPPRAPPLKRPPRRSDQHNELRHTPRRRPVQHRRHQHDDRAQVDPPPQKPHRRRRHPAPAPVPVAAETQPPVMLRAELARSAARLAREVRYVKHPAALAPRRPRLRGQVLVVLEQQRVEPRVAQNFVAQLVPSLFSSNRREPPRTGLIKLLEGVSLSPSPSMLQIPAPSHQQTGAGSLKIEKATECATLVLRRWSRASCRSATAS